MKIFKSAYGFFILFPLTILFLSLFIGEIAFRYIFKDFNFYPFGLLAVLLSFFVQPKRIWAQLQVVKYRVPRLAFFTFLSFFLSMASSLLFVVVFEMGVIGRVLGMFIGPIFLFAISFVDIFRNLRVSFSFEMMKEILVFGFPLIFAIWAYSVLNLTDRYMIERFLGLRQVGFYDIAHRIAAVPLFLSIGLRQMWTPLFYDNMEKRNYHVISRLMSFSIFAMCFICLLLVIFCKEVVVLMLDDRYLAVIPVIPWIVLGTFFLGLLPFSNAFLGYEKKFKHISAIASTAAILNIALNFILINHIGIIGAAIATATAYLLYLGFSIVVARKAFMKVFMIQQNIIPFLYVVASALLVNHFSGTKISGNEIFVKFCFLLVFIFSGYFVGVFNRSDITILKKKMIERIR
jgi:O-antigen/teichoic acid export membrane protein